MRLAALLFLIACGESRPRIVYVDKPAPPSEVKITACLAQSKPARPKFMCSDDGTISPLISCDYKDIDEARWRDYAKALEVWGDGVEKSCKRY